MAYTPVAKSLRAANIMLLDTPICDFGWKAPDFTISDPNGVAFTMYEQLGDKGLLIAFICNHCPYVKSIARHFAEDMRELQSLGLNVLAIMPNDYHAYPADNPAKMLEFAAEHNFQFPYLIDEDQVVARQYGAVCTPDFFGLNRHAKLQYRGRLDDTRFNKMSNSKRQKELVTAMRLVAATGKGPTEQVPSMGCSIKWRN